ncbi:MAG: hypothetical protein LH480_11520 [Rubrivivax sp.]|nr:hypothetical protein [Rubrivivax sp.]
MLALMRLPALAATTWCRDRLAEVGRNPLLAYTAGALLVLPALKLSGLYAAWAGLTGSAVEGLLRGLSFTAAVAAVTIAFTRRGWLWKT